jgi:hypothetical protein
MKLSPLGCEAAFANCSVASLGLLSAGALPHVARVLGPKLVACHFESRYDQITTPKQQIYHGRIFPQDPLPENHQERTLHP